MTPGHPTDGEGDIVLATEDGKKVDEDRADDRDIEVTLTGTIKLYPKC